MKRLVLLLAAFIAFNASALSGDSLDNIKKNYKTLKEISLEATLFESDIDESLFEVYEIEEEVYFDFDPKQYLPENFNSLAGKNDIDWSEVELINLEENVIIDFDTTKYLPENFNPLEGKNDIDWSSIELVELEEEVELGFDTSKYLPKGFNPYKGMNCEKGDVVVSLY